MNIDNSCNKYRPDFVMDCNTFFIIIELDEFSHKSYDEQCELTRMNIIIYSLGLSCVFLLINPDKFSDKFHNKITVNQRYTILKSYIDYYADKKLSDNTVEYLFY